MRSSLLRVPVSLAFLSALGLLVTACGELGQAFTAVSGAACPEIGGADATRTRYADAEQANIKLRAFVQAAKELNGVAAQAEAEAADACLRMGRDLGVPPQQMAPRNNDPGARADAACGALGFAIDGILRSGVQIHVNATPPACQATAQAYAQCSGSCQVSVDPGQIVAQCQPARLSGYCQGQCGGHCDGRCNGQCNGQCSARDAQGRCVGQCSGDCHGSCDATCHAQCSGTWQAPQCEGSVRPPSADAECDASCKAHASFTASCSPAMVNVQVSPGAQMGARLAATLQQNLPALLHAEIALGKRVLADAEVLGQVGAQLPRIIGQASAHAASCVAAGANATVRATASIRVTVRASASVSGRVGAGM
ncbi:MAG: hypothetical protein ABI193_16545 [Minicystis sp.]